MNEWKKIVGVMEIWLNGQKWKERPTQIIQIISHLKILNLIISRKTFSPNKVTFTFSGWTYLLRGVMDQMALVASVGDIRGSGSFPGLGRSRGGGHGNPLQYSCLENSTDRSLAG